MFKEGDTLVTDSAGLALPSPLCSKNVVPALCCLLSHELKFLFLSDLFPCLCPFKCLLLQYCPPLYCYCAAGEEEAGMFKKLAAFLMNLCTGRFRAKQHITKSSMFSGCLLRSSRGTLRRSLICGWSRDQLSPKPSQVLFFLLFYPSSGSRPCHSLTLREFPGDQ